MKTKKDGGSAFPKQAYIDKPDKHGQSDVVYENGGLSKREWFAGMAEIPWNVAFETLNKLHPERAGNFTVNDVLACQSAIQFMKADYMLAESERGEG